MFKHLNTRIPKRIEQEKDKVSAVMIPLIKKNDGYHILFEVRSNKLSQQPGEICFPGGRREHDETSMETSIRETCEELLISESNIKLKNRFIDEVSVHFYYQKDILSNVITLKNSDKPLISFRLDNTRKIYLEGEKSILLFNFVVSSLILFI